jgi:hypothetical protein
MNTRLFSSIIATGIALTGSASVTLTVCSTTATVAVAGCIAGPAGFGFHGTAACPDCGVAPDMTTSDLSPAPPDMIQAAEGGVTPHD